MREWGHRARVWAAGHRVDVALVLLVLAMTAPIVQDLAAQQASRMALTAAIWDDGSVRIDGYPLGVDRAERDGHTYSDKAPGQPLWAVPAYAAYRALGGEPAVVERVEGNLGLWTVSIWSSTVPAVALVLLARRVARRIDPEVATAVAVATALTTLLLPFASLLFGHVLGALLAFGGWALVTRAHPTRLDLFGAGMLLGAAVLVEYTMILPAAIIAALALYDRRAEVGWVLAGGLPGALALAAYQWIAFGSPTAFSYASSAFGTGADAAGLTTLDLSPVENLTRVLVGGRGLLTTTPIVIAGGVGTVLLARASRGTRRSGVVAAGASAVALLLVQVFWSNPTGGDSPGARYASAAAVFLVPGLAWAWTKRPAICAALAVAGGVIMLAATWTTPLAPRDANGVVQTWVRDLVEGRWASTIYEQATGATGARALLPVLTVAAAIGVVAAERAERLTRRREARA